MFKQSALRRPLTALVATVLSLQGTTSGAPLAPANLVVADPPVARPRTTPCVIPLFTDFTFADFSPKSFSYNPPTDCSGPFALVVLEGDFSVSAGRQFDRTASIWIGGANLYLGTTAEPARTLAPSWHIERELTDYSALLTTPQAGRVEIGNLVNATYTGVISGSARLLFYPPARGQEPPRVADVVLPLSAGSDGGTVALTTPGSKLARSFRLPRNIERAYLDVYAQSQGDDEFWYTCVPSDVADQLQSCAATAFREVEITVDGQPAGVAPIYPRIFTGGIDPYLWRPLPGVQTLAFDPYRVDLTPFAGLLNNGAAHEVGLSVYNANNNFATTATLLLTLDHAAKNVTGAVTRNTLAAAPTPTVKEELTTATGGAVAGTVTVRSARTFTITGYVNTTRGTIETEVQQDLQFSNQQRFDIAATKYVQDIQQRTTIRAQTRTKVAGEERLVSRQQDWPLDVHFALTTNADKSSEQTTTIRQQCDRSDLISTNGLPTYSSVQSNLVAPTNTLSFDPAGVLLGTKNQKSSQRYFAADSADRCYSRTVTAADGAITAVSDGPECGL